MVSLDRGETMSCPGLASAYVRVARIRTLVVSASAVVLHPLRAGQGIQGLTCSCRQVVQRVRRQRPAVWLQHGLQGTPRPAEGSRLGREGPAVRRQPPLAGVDRCVNATDLDCI